VTTPEADGGAPARSDAAGLAATVLDEEAARQEAQARSKEQVIFPDDLLPGVNSAPVSFGDAFAKGGVRMFVILGLMISFDQLTLNAVQTVEPELRATFARLARTSWVMSLCSRRVRSTVANLLGDMLPPVTIEDKPKLTSPPRSDSAGSEGRPPA
jgi:hypothetical protein